MLRWKGYRRDSRYLTGRTFFCVGTILPAAKWLGILKRIGWHPFRRTAASLLMSSGSSVKTTQELMRHATADITLELYAQAITEDKREVQNVLTGLIMGTQNSNVQTGVST